ncbi:hypothetical protein D3C77_795150 [compost metagenome]
MEKLKMYVLAYVAILVAVVQHSLRKLDVLLTQLMDVKQNIQVEKFKKLMLRKRL